MSTTTHSSSQQTCLPSDQLSAAKGQLQRCLQMLQDAKNDNEKMACLMLFTHLMKNNDLLRADSTEVFQAIGPRFIVRLLNSKSVPEGCPVFMYKALAVSILASFTEQKILFHPLVISNLRVITDILSAHEHVAEASELCEDCLKILLMFSRTQDGCSHLLENNCISVICHCVLHSPETDSLFEVFKGILLHLPQKTWAGNLSELSNLLELFSRTFAVCQDLKKFTICDKLVLILHSLCASNTEVQNDELLATSGAAWKGNIRKGVRDILQSRCKINYKYTALQLASSMVELFGIEWTLDSDQTLLDLSNSKVWFLLLSIVKTELKMILESDNEREIQDHSATLVACYKILERTIEFLISDKTGLWSLSGELILQMHTLLVESFDCIIQFLIHLGTSVDNAIEPEENVCCFRRPIVVATVRVLCAWLSEETNSLSDEVSKVLPILLDWARASFEQDEHISPVNLDSKLPDEILSYLLPPLCHLSADETFCCILIEKNVHIILAKYFDQLQQKQENDHKDYPSSLITLCNVFLNFAVLQVELVKSDVIFQDVLDSIMLSLSQMMHSNCVVLLAHFTLLGLLLFRHRYPSDSTNLSAVERRFFSAAIDFLRQAQIALSGEVQQSEMSVSLQREWDQVSELWFLSLQNILACAKLIKPVKEVLNSSGWINETNVWLDKWGKDGDKTLTELVSALGSIVNLGSNYC